MFIIEPYNNDYETLWDNFIYTKAVNGTFLQSRKFLNYHPAERFTDCSLLVFNNDKNNLAAVIPACLDIKDPHCFYSHKGSTYGGIIIAEKYYTSMYVLEIVEAVETYLKKNNFTSLYLKLTPDIFSSVSPALLEYILYFKQYEQFSELNTYIDFANYKENILSNFFQGKRTNVNNCLKENMEYRRVNSNEEIQVLHNIISDNLKKYNVKPVHTYDELIQLKENYIPDNIDFFVCLKDNEIIAGAIVFYFEQVLHTQYLCAKEEFAKLSPMSFVYYAMILEAKAKGLKKLSWGVSTENMGRILNKGLLCTKEYYGSTYSLNKTFFKYL